MRDDCGVFPLCVGRIPLQKRLVPIDTHHCLIRRLPKVAYSLKRDLPMVPRERVYVLHRLLLVWPLFCCVLTVTERGQGGAES